MKKFKLFLMMFCTMLAVSSFSSCKDDDDSNANKEFDSTLYGEWIENDGNTYVHGYMRFDSDGTGISGSYESDIDWVNEDDDFQWYTANDEYLYINGTCYKYWCDGSSLTTESASGKTRSYWYWNR